ncbi:MAG: single-stranded DNA-binding protein [Chloroflexi bacterium]|nr:single-stranded DNA-binding protein [Chloroflexota bacterium]
MSASLNKVMIIGNVGRDPEMRYTQNGTAVTSFSVAAGRRWTTPEGEQREETEWFNVVTWNKLAETANRYITKGSRVYIEGRLQTRSWEGQDGQKRYRTEVVAQTMIMLDSRPRATAASEEEISPDDIEPEEIPF